MNIQQAMNKILNGHNLAINDMREVMMQIMTGKATGAQIGGFLIGLRMKGETVEEITGAAQIMRELSVPLHLTNEHLVDIAGTGGDGAGVFNVSTASTFVAAAAGAHIAKHGNRGVSSSSGSADLLEYAGVNLDLSAEQIALCVEEVGIGFMFAVNHHSAMKHAVGPRKELGVPTIFNILGPLSNPAKPKACAIGVARSELLPLMAQVLLDQGKEGFVFRGDDGLDEVSLSTTTTVIQISNGKIEETKFDPEELGVSRAELSELAGGDAKVNARFTREILGGKTGAMRDAVTLNAAFAIAAFKGDFHLPLQTQIANGLVLANKAIDSGAALSVLVKWAELSNEIVSAR